MLGEHVHASLHEIHQILCGGKKTVFGKQRIEQQQVLDTAI